MTNLNQNLQEKLGLLDNYEFVEINKRSKNIKYLIKIDGVPTYFLKIYNHEKVRKEITEREEGAMRFFDANNLLRIPKPVHFGEGYVLSEYEGELQNINVECASDEIIQFHKKALLHKDYSAVNGPRFHNDYRERGMLRISRYGPWVGKLHNPRELEKIISKVPSKYYGCLPKILNHGDFHSGNIQMKTDGITIFLDFERSCYDSPTWDIARAMLCMEIDKIDNFLEGYLSAMKNTSLFEDADKKYVKKAILGDCIYRIITDTIADHQAQNLSIVAERHLENNREFIRKYFYKNWGER